MNDRSRYTAKPTVMTPSKLFHVKHNGRKLDRRTK